MVLKPIINHFQFFLKKSSPVKRNELMKILSSKGIASRRGIMNAHLETAYKKKIKKLPISENYYKNSIIIPLYISLKNDQIYYIINEIKKLLIT